MSRFQLWPPWPCSPACWGWHRHRHRPLPQRGGNRATSPAGQAARPRRPGSGVLQAAGCGVAFVKRHRSSHDMNRAAFSWTQPPCRPVCVDPPWKTGAWLQKEGAVDRPSRIAPVASSAMNTCLHRLISGTSQWSAALPDRHRAATNSRPAASPEPSDDGRSDHPRRISS